MLNCQHHISWVREVPGGLHQCILCFQVVTKKDVSPKLEELPEEFRRRWDAHEATRPPPAPAEPAAAKPAPSPAPARPPAAAAGNGSSPDEPDEGSARPVPRSPPGTRIPAPPAIPADPRSGG